MLAERFREIKRMQDPRNTAISDAAVSPYFSGNKLYGDDFPPQEVAEWFRDEESAYFELAPRTRDNYQYEYHAINEYHGFRYLPQVQFENVLGIGSAFGEELRPLLSKIAKIAILEPAVGFKVSELEGVPVRYVSPQCSGDLPFPSEQFNLVTCLGVLHHIANVTKVMREIYRCTAKGGHFLLREPVISMGDWRSKRPGLTKRERGIPIHLLRAMIRDSGFVVVHEARCFFPLTPRFRYFMRSPVFNSRWCVYFDGAICRLPWTTRYHAAKPFHKLRPWAIYYVLRKP